MNWHVFKVLDGFFLFDTPSNSLFAIDEPTFEVLHARETGVDEAKKPASDLMKEVLKDIEELQSMGYLKDKDPFLEAPYFNMKPNLKALCLHLAHDCQLRCVYCFAGGGAFGGDRSLMTPEVGRAAIDFLLRESGERKHLEIDFFGGEPLLNRTLLMELVEYGEANAVKLGKILHFTLTTNTLGLDKEILDFLREHQMGLVLSLDGRPEINDRMRGKGTHDKIVPRILEVVQNYPELNYYVRGTYSHFNLDFGEDVRHLHEMGIESISVEPVTCDPSLPYALQLTDIPEITREYHRLAEYCRRSNQEGKPIRFFHFQVDLEKSPCLPKRLLGCGAGHDYLAVTPQGDLYPCHQFVGEKDYLLGDVFVGLTQNKVRETFSEARLYSKDRCGDCWARYYCSGGCHANAYFANGDIHRPDRMACELQKIRLECALGLKAAMMAGEESY